MLGYYFTPFVNDEISPMKQKQPKALYLLFFTELWERFGFYTLQTIAVLYMVHALGYSDDKAFLVYGAFTAMLYLTPVFGGDIADRFMGFQRAIMYGGALLSIGYLVTAIPSDRLFFYGLAILILANGLFKPNVSSIVGELYEKNDARRDSGFTIFYIGINIGSLIPPLFLGWLVNKEGWHAGFLIAALGMVISLVTFYVGRTFLGDKGGIPITSRLHKSKSITWRFYSLFTLGLIFCSFLAYGLLYIPEKTNIILIVGSLAIILWIVKLMLKQPEASRNKMLAALILTIISIGFWSIYNETFTALMLFADRNMGQHMLGLPIDAEATQFFNPFFIFVLGPFFSWLWVKLDRTGYNPSAISKFTLGVFFIALGFFELAYGTQYHSVNGVTSPWWLAISYMLQTIGELLLSPIGLSMITQFAPRKHAGKMMGLWFLSLAASYAISARLATIADVPTTLNVVQSSPIYTHAFYIYGWIALGLTAVSFTLIPYIKRLTRA